MVLNCSAPVLTPLILCFTHILDGCYHVYLDVGSNVGIQVRKLFEPTKYPKAFAHKVFREAFGVNRDPGQVCAVGFEPNPRHAEKLRGIFSIKNRQLCQRFIVRLFHNIAIEAAYAKCGWNAKFFKETGVSNKDGKGTFFTDEAKAHNEWGGGIVRSNKNVKRTVKGRKKIQEHPVKRKANV